LKIPVGRYFVEGKEVAGKFYPLRVLYGRCKTVIGEEAEQRYFFEAVKDYESYKKDMEVSK
jgi:hypothetical protein